ncbi:MAG: TRAP transporter large permease subunit [Beijerinckiaceae bacterium]
MNDAGIPAEATAPEIGVIQRLRAQTIVWTRPIAFVGIIGMFVAATATVLDVLVRWLANAAVPALNEIVALAFAVAITACLPSGLAAGVGITIDILERFASRKLSVAMKAFGGLCLLCVFGILTWRMGNYAQALYAEGRTTVILLIPRAPFIWASTILLGIATAVQLVAVARQVEEFSGVQEKIEWRAADMFLVLMLLFTGSACVLLMVEWQEVSYWCQDNPVKAVLIAFGCMWLLLLMLLPLAAVLAIVGLIGSSLLLSSEATLSAFATEAEGFLANYQVATLPMFLMMGSFAAVSGIADDIYSLAQAVLGRFRGGLAMATIGGCAGFGAVTGSSLATVATFGRVALPQMDARRYAPEFAAGCVAAGGTLGALIPPSGALIIFALLTEASIGQLFVAAVIPGLLAVLFYLLAIVVAVRVRPSLAPPRERPPAGEIGKAVRNCGPVALLFGTVIGGMYSGIFTATEAAAVGAIGAFLLALIRGRLNRERFWDVMSETTLSTALIYSLIFGVLIFSFFVAASALPERATEFIGALTLPPILVLIVILVCYLLLGCIMDSFTVMIVTVPIITPVVLSMGYDMLWWGVVNLIVVEVGLITPPFGLHLFVLKSMLPGVSLVRMYQGVLPFCLADFFKLVVLVAFPVLTLWLPSTMAR